MRKFKIEINQCKDFEEFFQKSIQNGRLMEEYRGSQINFYINLKNVEKEKVDEQLFFYYCLIENRFGTEAKIRAIVVIDITFSRFQKSSNYYRLNTFLYQQLNTSLGQSLLVYCREEKTNRKVFKTWQIKELQGVGRLLPLLTVNGRFLATVQRPITPEIWETIKTFPQKFAEKTLITTEDILFHLCHRFLFYEIENETITGKLRHAAFNLKSFYDAIRGLPLLALIIFAVFDYYYRSDLAMLYKEKIKEETKAQNVYLRPSDFLKEWQDTQGYQHYKIHQQMCRSGLDIKTILTTADQEEDIRKTQCFLEKLDSNSLHMELHSKLIGELYEAVSIAEGLIQLVENTVYHAGIGEGENKRNGEGMLSMHIHRCINRGSEKITGYLWDDTDDLEKHYRQYIQKHIVSNPNRNLDERPVQYFLEVKLADISSTDIPSKFKDNHYDYISTSPKKDLFNRFSLRSFFAPTMEENEAWEQFYQHATHIVNHYGLQIFNSTVHSKNGFFYVTSQNDSYCSLQHCGQENMIPFIQGTAYSILLPLSAHIGSDSNIYDSMLEYDLQETLKENWDIVPVQLKTEVSIQSQHDKTAYIESVYNELKQTEPHTIKVFDVSSVRFIEGVVKGVMRYVYRHKEGQIRIAFINCRTCEIVNVVRLFSLFYNRQAQNLQMENVQIYIRGKRVGEELLFYGKELPEVENNIAKMACMRGLLYDNYRVLHDIFHRDTIERN